MRKITINKNAWKKFALFMGLFCVIGALYMPLMVFYGPFKDIRRVAIGSLLTSRHGSYLKWLLTAEELKAIDRAKLDLYKEGTGKVAKINVSKNHSKDIEVVDIRTAKFKGKMMFISDPSRVKIGISENLGETGQKTSEIAKSIGAVAAINGGGFADVKGKGTGGLPEGITIHEGKIIGTDYGNMKGRIIGINKDGVLVVGRYSVDELKNMDLMEAVTFGPQIIDDGNPLIRNGDGGWGVAPRTLIGQKKNGTIIFLVLDGRQLDSVGATLRDAQDIMLANGAVTAANLDGGSSATMVYQGKVINSPSDVFGERYVPTAFVVIP